MCIWLILFHLFFTQHLSWDLHGVCKIPSKTNTRLRRNYLHLHVVPYMVWDFLSNMNWLFLTCHLDICLIQASPSTDEELRKLRCERGAYNLWTGRDPHLRALGPRLLRCHPQIRPIYLCFGMQVVLNWRLINNRILTDFSPLLNWD